MVQFNFLIDVEFLLMHMYDASIPITIIHGQNDPPRYNVCISFYFRNILFKKKIR